MDHAVRRGVRGLGIRRSAHHQWAFLSACAVAGRLNAKRTMPSVRRTAMWRSVASTAMADAVERIMSEWAQYRESARARAVARFSKQGWLAQHRRVFEKLAAA